MEVRYYRYNREEIIKVLDALVEVEKELESKGYILDFYFNLDDYDEIKITIYGYEYECCLEYEIEQLIETYDIVSHLVHEIKEHYVDYVGTV